MFLMNTSSLHMVVHFYSGGYFLPCSSPTGKLTRHVALSRQYNPLRSLIVSLFELWGLDWTYERRVCKGHANASGLIKSWAAKANKIQRKIFDQHEKRTNFVYGFCNFSSINTLLLLLFFLKEIVPFVMENIILCNINQQQD